MSENETDENLADLILADRIARKIQCAYRQRLARRELIKRRVTRKEEFENEIQRSLEEASAIMIQSRARAFLARESRLEKDSERKQNFQEEVENDRRELAAITVQQGVRGMFQRRKAANSVEQKSLEVQSLPTPKPAAEEGCSDFCQEKSMPFVSDSPENFPRKSTSVCFDALPPAALHSEASEQYSKQPSEGMALRKGSSILLRRVSKGSVSLGNLAASDSASAGTFDFSTSANKFLQAAFNLSSCSSFHSDVFDNLQQQGGADTTRMTMEFLQEAGVIDLGQMGGQEAGSLLITVSAVVLQCFARRIISKHKLLDAKRRKGEREALNRMQSRKQESSYSALSIQRVFRGGRDRGRHGSLSHKLSALERSDEGNESVKDEVEVDPFEVDAAVCTQSFMRQLLSSRYTYELALQHGYRPKSVWYTFRPRCLGTALSSVFQFTISLLQTIRDFEYAEAMKTLKKENAEIKKRKLQIVRDSEGVRQSPTPQQRAALKPKRLHLSHMLSFSYDMFFGLHALHDAAMEEQAKKPYVACVLHLRSSRWLSCRVLKGNPDYSTSTTAVVDSPQSYVESSMALSPSPEATDRNNNENEGEEKEVKELLPPSQSSPSRPPNAVAQPQQGEQQQAPIPVAVSHVADYPMAGQRQQAILERVCSSESLITPSPQQSPTAGQNEKSSIQEIERRLSQAREEREVGGGGRLSSVVDESSPYPQLREIPVPDISVSFPTLRPLLSDTMANLHQRLGDLVPIRAPSSFQNMTTEDIHEVVRETRLELRHVERRQEKRAQRCKELRMYKTEAEEMKKRREEFNHLLSRRRKAEEQWLKDVTIPEENPPQHPAHLIANPRAAAKLPPITPLTKGVSAPVASIYRGGTEKEEVLNVQGIIPHRNVVRVAPGAPARYHPEDSDEDVTEVATTTAPPKISPSVTLQRKTFSPGPTSEGTRESDSEQSSQRVFPQYFDGA